LACGTNRSPELDRRRIGEFLHARQDSYSHRKDIERNLDVQWESVLAWVRGPGNPDLPWNEPDDFRTMFAEIRTLLVEIFTQCGAPAPNSRPPVSFADALRAVERWADRENELGIGAPGVRQRWADLTRAMYGSRFSAYATAESLVQQYR
jgi:hypothetical protein